jgi:hypothetical protein
MEGERTKIWENKKEGIQKQKHKGTEKDTKEERERIK